MFDSKGNPLPEKVAEPVLLMPDRTGVPLSQIEVIGITTKHRVLIRVPSAVPQAVAQNLVVMAKEFFSPAKVLVIKDNIEVTISEDPKEPEGTDGPLSRN